MILVARLSTGASAICSTIRIKRRVPCSSVAKCQLRLSRISAGVNPAAARPLAAFRSAGRAFPR